MLVNKLRKYITVVREGYGLVDKVKIFFLIPFYILSPIKKFNIEVVIKNDDGKFKCRNIEDVFMYSLIREEEMRKYFKLYKKNSMFIDVGAYIGKYAIMLANKNPHAKIIAIEPDRKSASIIDENIRFNSIENIDVIKKVVSDKSSKKYFYFNLDKPTQNTLYKEELSGQFKYIGGKRQYKYKKTSVKTIILDSLFLHGKDVELIKLDIQGEEISALKGAKKIIHKFKPRIIFEAYTRDRLKEIKDLLKKENYKIRRIDKFNYIARA